MPGLRTARRLARRGLDDVQARAAARAAGRVTAPVRVCWDLDNTLVDSGSLLREGQALEAAVVAAAPLPGMLELVAALRERLPGAEHVVLSARRRPLRTATTAWLGTHEARLATGTVLLVPRASDKPRVWRRLAAGGRLLIVDDLTYGHESQVRPYADLIATARELADVHLGVDDVAAVVADPGSAGAVADRVATRLDA